MQNGYHVDFSKFAKNPENEIEIETLEKISQFITIYVEQPVFKHEGMVYDTWNRKAANVKDITESFSKHPGKVVFHQLEYRNCSLTREGALSGEHSFLVKYYIMD